jgi:hypothetical protein
MCLTQTSTVNSDKTRVRGVDILQIIIIIIIIIIKAKNSISDPDSNIIYGSNSKVTITKSNKT